MQAAIHEIRRLRHRNEILSAKEEVVEAFSRALHAPRDYGQPMEPDICYLQQLIEQPETDTVQE